eukprot:s3138_g7.t1
MDALPVQLEGHAHPRLPCGLRAVTYAINGLEIPLAWSGVAQEVRDSHGQLRYRGVEAWQGSQELEGGESARSWVLPSRLAAAWCTLGGRGEVLGLDDQGNPCRSGPFWVLYGTNGSELWAEGSSEIAPEEGLSGDLHACRKSLLSLFGNSGTERDPPSRADYLEVFGSTPLGDHLRHRGLRVPVSEALEDCWSVSGRTSIRNHVRHHRPRILAARWSSSSSFLSVPEGASSLVRGRLVHGFALELVREQVQRGDHFVIDYEADNLCAEGEAVEDLAMFVQSYQEQGKPRLLASSFPVRLSVEESRQAGSLEDVTGPLRDRVAEERCAKELLEEMNFSFEACAPSAILTQAPCAPFNHGGVWGMTCQTKLRPHFVNYINRFLDWHGAVGPRTSFCVNTGVALGVHIDKFNYPDFGCYVGGRLWVEDACQALGGSSEERCVKVLENGRSLD